MEEERNSTRRSTVCCWSEWNTLDTKSGEKARQHCGKGEIEEDRWKELIRRWEQDFAPAHQECAEPEHARDSNTLPAQQRNTDLGGVGEGNPDQRFQRLFDTDDTSDKCHKRSKCSYPKQVFRCPQVTSLKFKSEKDTWHSQVIIYTDFVRDLCAQSGIGTQCKK